MCKSITEGGHRCAAHTRPAFQAVEARIAQAVLCGDARALDAARSDWDQVALDYAATREGKAHFTGLLSNLPDDDHDATARYTTLLRRAEEMRAACAAIAIAVAAAETARKMALAATPDVLRDAGGVSAREHVTRPQVLPVEHLMGLESLEGEGTVRDWVDQKSRDPYADEDLQYHRESWESVRTQPVTVMDNTLTDGHHRVMVAEEEGETHLPVRYI